MELVIERRRMYQLLIAFFTIEVALGALALVSPLLFGIILGTSAAIIFGFAVSEVALLKTLFFFIPFGVTFYFSGFEFPSVQLLLLAVMVVSLLKVCAGSLVFQRTSLHVWMGLFILTFFISLARTPSYSESVKELFRWLPFLFSYFFAAQAFNQEAEVKSAAWWLVGLLVAQVLIAFVLFPVGPAGVLGRLKGTMGNPNTLAIYLVLNLGLVTSLWLSPIPQHKRRWALLALSITLLALIVTHTRGGWLGAFFSILSLLFLKSRGERKRVLKFLMVLLLIGVFAIVIFSPSIEMLKHTKGSFVGDSGAVEYDTAFVRVLEAVIMWEIIKSHPVFGTGIGSFRMLLEKQLEGIPDIIDFTADAFTIYLQFWLELGLLGLLAFLAIIYVIFKRGRQLVKHYKDDPEYQAIVIGILANFVGFLMHGFVDMVIYSVGGFLFWMEVGMIFALERLSSERNPAENG